MYLFLEYSVIASGTQQHVITLGFETKKGKIFSVWIVSEFGKELHDWVFGFAHGNHTPWSMQPHYYFRHRKAFMWPAGQFRWRQVCVSMCPQCCPCCFIVPSKIGTCWTIGVADANSRESEVTVPLPWGFTPKKSPCNLVSSCAGGNLTVESSLK